MKSNKIVLLLYITISIIFVGYIIGYKNLIPSETDWIFTSNDLISYYLPLFFYNSDSWSFDLFKNFNYGLEISENMFFYDTVQILNPLIKLLSKTFETPIQYVSLWKILNVTLQGLFAFKIIYFKTKNISYSFLVGLFFILIPFFLDRLFIHTFVGSHWLILWSIYLIIKYDINIPLKKWSLLLFISVFINIYLTIMILLFLYLFLAYLYLFKEKNFHQTIKLFLYFTTIFLIFLFLAGFFSINVSNYPEYGFGHFKSNSLSFLDFKGGILNLDWSILLGDINTLKGEEEGFAFLGISFFVIFLLLVFNFNFKDYLSKKNLFYLSSFVVFFLLAITNKVSFATYQIIDLPLNKYIFGVLSFVRASGRFIWLPAYLIAILLFIKLYHIKISKRYIIFALSILLLAQTFDQKNALLELKKDFQFNNISDEDDEYFWKKLSQNYPYFKTSLILADPRGVKINGKIIAKNGFKGTNIVYFARSDRRKLANARYATFIDIYKKKIKEDTIYWIHPTHLNHILYIYGSDNKYSIFEFKNQHYLIKNKSGTNILKRKKLSIENINLPEIEINSNLNPHNVKHLFGMGWFTIGSFWSDGPISSMLFKNYPNMKKIVFETEIFNYNLQTIKNFEFFINNQKIKKFEITRKENILIEIPIENIFLKDINEMIFKNKSNITRADISIYPDPRLLGFKIKSLYFSD